MRIVITVESHNAAKTAGVSPSEEVDSVDARV